MESLLQDKIETLRSAMIERAMKCGSLTDKTVVSISQQLDRYIVLYQKIKSKKMKLNQPCCFVGMISGVLLACI